MGSAEKRPAFGGMIPYALGFCALLTMLIPRLALQTLYASAVRGVMCGILVYIEIARKSIRQGIMFMLAMSAAAWLLDLEEGIVICFLIAAGLVLLLSVRRAQGNIYLWIVIGCLLSVLILVAGSSGLLLWRKEHALAKAIEYGFRSEIATCCTALIGGLAGGYLAERRLRQ